MSKNRVHVANIQVEEYLDRDVCKHSYLPFNHLNVAEASQCLRSLVLEIDRALEEFR